MSQQDVNNIIRDIWIRQYTLLAASVVLVCEYLATIGDEKRLIWASRFSLPKFLFFLNRYTPFVTIGTILHFFLVNKRDNLCLTGLYIGGMFSTVEYVVAEAILYFRAYAVWGYDIRVAIFLSISFLCSAVMGIYITVIFTGGVVVLSPIRLMHSGCMFSFTSRIEWISLAIVIYCETITLSILLYKIYSQYRHCLTENLSPILSTMIKDGVFFYICILATSIANIVILLVARPNLRNFLLMQVTNPQGVIHSVLCNRLLLRIRGAYESMCERSLILHQISAATPSAVSSSSPLFHTAHVDKAHGASHYDSSPEQNDDIERNTTGLAIE